MDAWTHRQTDGLTDGQTDGRTYTQIPPVFYRTSSPSGLLPKMTYLADRGAGESLKN